jgi:hypothetical protein
MLRIAAHRTVTACQPVARNDDLTTVDTYGTSPSSMLQYSVSLLAGAKNPDAVFLPHRSSAVPTLPSAAAGMRPKHLSAFIQSAVTGVTPGQDITERLFFS